jgi:hypothetical protein
MSAKVNKEWDPYYRLLPRGPHTPNSHPKCVIAGPNRRNAVLYVHGPTPCALPLTPQLVAFLRDALADLPAARTLPVD